VEEKLLTSFQQRALKILRELETGGISRGFVHGSVARGDVKTTSDIDIYIPLALPSFRVDLLSSFQGAERRIMMATPNSIIRGVLARNDDISISFPLMATNERDIEFFQFSGLVNLDKLEKNQRTPGITKQLILIEPEGNGYWRTPLQEDTKRVVQLLGLSQLIIDERVRVLSRRDKIGRTGVFMNVRVHPHENFEQALKQLADHNPVVRRALRS
jgi:predicted nucleotidyltransferase